MHQRPVGSDAIKEWMSIGSLRALFPLTGAAERAA